MAHTIFDDFSTDTQSGSDATIIKVNGEQMLDIPSEAFVRDAEISRDGMDLVLEANGETVVIEGYFSAEVTPSLIAPNGVGLTPDLVESFIQGGNQYADASPSMTDASPVGAVHEVSGDATVTRTDGSVEKITLGTPIFQGDVVETDEYGAVNIMFIDETKFAVSEDARLAIDEYVFDPSTNEGVTNFSVLKGVFVFTSGLIGRDDPDDVMIDTPAGSIGIRGTIIAGNVDTGEVTVIEGAIVMNDLFGNSITLANQYETAQFNSQGQTIDPVGQLSPDDVGAKFSSVSTVSADLFSSIVDSSIEGKEPSENKSIGEELQGSEEQPQETQNSEDASEEGEQLEQKSEETQENAPDEANGEEQSQEEAGLEEALLEDISNIEVIDPLQAQQGLGDGPQGSNVDITTGGSTITAGSQPPPPPSAPLPPPPNAINPFKLSFNAFSVAENSLGGELLYQITGSGAGGPVTNVQLLGTSNNFYDIVLSSTLPNTYEIFAQDGLNFEDPQLIWIRATDANGNEIVQHLGPTTTDVDENVTAAVNPTPTGVGAALNAFAVSDNATIQHDFNIDFNNEDAGNLVFGVGNFTGGASAGLFDADLIAGTSDGSWDFTSGVATNLTGSFDITATNTITGLSHTITYTFESFAQNNITISGGLGTAASPTLLSLAGGGPGFFSGTNIGYQTNDNDVTIFTTGLVNNYIETSGDGTKIYSGEGRDEIHLQASASGFEVYAGEGDDYIYFDQTGAYTGFAFGDEGSDIFEFTVDGQAGAAFASVPANSTFIDGGSGIDFIQLETGVNDDLDFTSYDPEAIKNIEVISTDNDSTSGNGNVITLSYQNVIDMTDANNTLVVDFDANDTFIFNLAGAPGGQEFFVAPTQVEAPNGENYYMFTDGVITLFVDADISAQL